MKEKLAKLISVKSIVTLILTIVFSYITIRSVISGSEFLAVYTTVIGFYFGTQAAKNINNGGDDDGNQNIQ